MPAPTLETERLVLLPPTATDRDESAALWTEEAVTRYLGGRPFTREESWSRFLRYAGLWSLLGYGYWVVRDRASRRYVGEVGFADFERELVPSIAGRPEAGWVLASWAQGRGLATEAVRAIHAWGDVHLPTRATVCLIDPENLASLQVAAKLGYRATVRTTYKERPTWLLER